MTQKTPQYTKDAINKYNEKFDRIAVNLPKGTKERIRKLIGMSCNAYISELVLKDLEQRENSLELPTSTEALEEIAKEINNKVVSQDCNNCMKEKPEPVKIVQPEKSPDSVIFDGLEVSPERAKEIQEKLDQQFKAKEEQEKHTPKRDSFMDTLERLRKDNQDGKLALNVREDI